VFIKEKDDGGGVDYWSFKSCKAPVKSSPPTNQQPVFLQAGCPSCRPTNIVKALKGKLSVMIQCFFLTVVINSVYYYCQNRNIQSIYTSENSRWSRRHSSKLIFACLHQYAVFLIHFPNASTVYQTCTMPVSTSNTYRLVMSTT